MENNINKTFIFESYASIFNQVDRNNEVVIDGSFNLDENSKDLKVFYNHDTDILLGKVIEIKQDSVGLYVKFEITESNLNKDILSLIRSELLLSMSIGYLINESFENNGIKYLTSIDLLEISVVNIPVNKNAKIFSITEKNINQNIPLYHDPFFDQLILQ